MLVVGLASDFEFAKSEYIQYRPVSQPFRRRRRRSWAELRPCIGPLIYTSIKLRIKFINSKSFWLRSKWNEPRRRANNNSQSQDRSHERKTMNHVECWLLSTRNSIEMCTLELFLGINHFFGSKTKRSTWKSLFVLTCDLRRSNWTFSWSSVCPATPLSPSCWGSCVVVGPPRNVII